MKADLRVLVAMASWFVAPSYALDFWHSGTVWANGGICSAEFVFDSGMEAISNLQVSVVATNKAGKKVTAGMLRVEQFGQSASDRYAKAFLENEEVCEEDLTIVVRKATATIESKPIDLLKNKAISARVFKPFKIRVGN